MTNGYKPRMEMDINRQWYLVDTPYSGDLEVRLGENLKGRKHRMNNI